MRPPGVSGERINLPEYARDVDLPALPRQGRGRKTEYSQTETWDLADSFRLARDSRRIPRAAAKRREHWEPVHSLI